MAEMKFRGAGVEEINHGPPELGLGTINCAVIQTDEARMAQSPAGTSQRNLPSPRPSSSGQRPGFALAMMFDLLFGTAAPPRRGGRLGALLITRTILRSSGNGSASWNLAGPVTVVV